jgi:amyloid beta precursor protein binding protein 1
MATTDKYDRQLRLWGANGQRALMDAHILLIQADSVGTETLKNLVLPGVGAFTILDDFTVDQQDLGCNFFVEEQSLLRPRAEVVTELLCEMNSDVTGFAKVANFQNLFQTEPEYFCAFSLIVSANLPEQQLLPLAQLCWERRIPLLVVKSYGLVGSVRLQLRAHSVVESRSEADAFDLRVSRPFPGLQVFCESAAKEMATLDSLEHAHVPYPVILHAAIALWRAQHSKNPSTFAEKDAFKAQIKGMSRDYNNEVNFHEAVRYTYM